MPVSHTDNLFQETALGLDVDIGLWVRLHNNDSAVDYYATAITGSLGDYTHSAPPGDYSVYTGSAATVPGTPTLRNSHYPVPATSDAVLLDTAQTLTGVKHFSAAPVFDAGFTVSAGAVSFPANAIVDAAINSLSASKLTGANGLPDAVLSTNVDLLNGVQAFSVVKTFNAAPVFAAGFSLSAGHVGAFGTGDNVQAFYADVAGRLIDVRGGTAGAPDTAIGPLLKVSRVISLTAGQITGDGAGEANAVAIDVTNDVADEVAIVGLYVAATTISTTLHNGNPDADSTAIEAIGKSTGNSNHLAIGLTVKAINNAVTAGAGGRLSAIQATADNTTGVDATVQAAGFSGGAIYIDAVNATGKAGAAIEIANAIAGAGATAKAAMYDVGLHFNGAVVNGNTGAIDTAAIQDDSTAATSLLINGTHATAAIAIKAGAGPALFGGVAQLASGSLLEVQGPNATTDPLVQFGSIANNQAYSMYFRNNSGITKWVVAAGTNQFFTGTIAGDSGLQAGTANKFVHLAGSVSVVKVGNDNTLKLQPTVATAAGGAIAFSLGVTPALGVYFGSGAPTVSAPKGSLYLRTDGTTTNDRMFVNTNGTTTWTAVTTAA